MSNYPERIKSPPPRQNAAQPQPGMSYKPVPPPVPELQPRTPVMGFEPLIHWPIIITWRRWSAIWSVAGLALGIMQLIGG
jgi:hypothetical protein